MKHFVHQAIQRGVTLVELIVSIVVISIGLAGILVVIDRTTRSSSDALVEHQAIAIAEAYLEEITAKPFCDPDGALCQVGNAPGTANCPVCPATEGMGLPADRALYDNVCDYNGLPDTVVRDQNGAAVAGLNGYNVAVTVLTDGVLGPASSQLAGGNCAVLTVQVRVTGIDGTNITLTGYRTNY